MFNGCSVEEIPSLNFSKLTNASSLFDVCVYLRKIGSINLSAITSSLHLLRSNFNISESNITGLRFTHTYSGSKLSRLALINIFNNLGSATTQTLDIRFNPGTAELTPSDIAIATSKGWTVTV
jgi:hypothetical protein